MPVAHDSHMASVLVQKKFPNGTSPTSLRSPNEFTQSHAQGARQSVSNLDTDADLAQFDGANVRPVDVSPLREVFLGQS